MDLAEIVDHLYDAALCSSSRRTYGTGQRAYFRFASEIKSETALTPFGQKFLMAPKGIWKPKLINA